MMKQTFSLLLASLILEWENVIIEAQDVLFTDISVGGSFKSPTVWVCALLDESLMECFMPRIPLDILGPINFETKAKFVGTQSIQFDSISLGGDGRQTVWACAGDGVSTSECTKLRSDASGIVELEVDSFIEETTQLDIGGSSTATVYTCAVTPTGGLGCLLLTFGETSLPFRATIDNTDIRQVSVGGSGSGTSQYTCFVADIGVSCINPATFSSADDILASLPGNYSEVSVNGGGTATISACAINQGTGNIDCWSPSSYIVDNGVYQVTSRLSTGRAYSQISIGGASTTTIVACALAELQIDCFSTTRPTDANGNHEIIGRIEGSYSKVSVDGGSGSTIYGCALRTDGSRIDCFGLTEETNADGTFKLAGSYGPPTPAPTSVPTITPFPTPVPTSSPTRDPASTPVPTTSPSMNPASTPEPGPGPPSGANSNTRSSLFVAGSFVISLVLWMS